MKNNEVTCLKFPTMHPSMTLGVNFNDRDLNHFYIEIKIRKQKCTFESFLFRNWENIIPMRLILFRKWSIVFWKARCTLYVYDSKTGRREMGNFR